MQTKEGEKRHLDHSCTNQGLMKCRCIIGSKRKRLDATNDSYQQSRVESANELNAHLISSPSPLAPFDTEDEEGDGFEDKGVAEEEEEEEEEEGGWDGFTSPPLRSTTDLTWRSEGGKGVCFGAEARLADDVDGPKGFPPDCGSED